MGRPKIIRIVLRLNKRPEVNMLYLRKDTIARIYHRYLPLAIIYFLYISLVNSITFMSFISHKQNALVLLNNNAYYLARDIGQFFHDAATKNNPIDIVPILDNSPISSEILSVFFSGTNGADTLNGDTITDTNTSSEILTQYIFFTNKYPYFLVTPDRPTINGIDKRNFKPEYLTIQISSKATNHDILSIFVWHLLCLALFIIFPIAISLYFYSVYLAKKMDRTTLPSPSNPKGKQVFLSQSTSGYKPNLASNISPPLSVVHKVLFMLMDTPINALQRSYLHNVFHILEDVDIILNANAGQSYKKEIPIHSNDTKAPSNNLAPVSQE
ncbi:MAG: hypothetical protein KUG76_08270 [Gammaproteobacteria bacterium]|nr:hypothetical protein [Gammaproteobacteria bacterium]